MHFLYPQILITLPGILIIWWIFFREKIGYEMPNSLFRIHSYVPRVLGLLWFIRGIIAVLLFFILSCPSIESHETVTRNTEKNIVLVLDISKSMLAEDIIPNRITQAKMVLQSFLDHPSGDRFSYIVFAGKPFLLASPTYDLTALQKMIHDTSPDLIKQELPGLSGTNMGDALILASSVIGSGSGAIILMTDGRANMGIDPILASRNISTQQHIPIFTIGIGDASGSILSYTDENGHVQYFYNEKGELLKADIDETMLKNIASITGGMYFHAATANNF